MTPLTCTGINESFWVTTGTTKIGEIFTDIKLAAQSTATVVLLMAMNKLEAIKEIMITNGKANTPGAIIQDGTTTKEKMVIGKVKDIYFRSQIANFTNPAIIKVGNVVDLHARNHKKIIKSTIKKDLKYI